MSAPRAYTARRLTCQETYIGRGGRIALAVTTAVVSLFAGWSTASAGAVGFTAVSGTVTDAATHKGIPGIEACFHWLPEGGYYCETTGPQGQYGLQVAEKKYWVEFKGQPLGYVTQFFDHKLYRGDADIISVGSKEVTGLDGELLTGGEIRGDVTAVAGGEPVAHVEACAREVDTEYLFACGETDSSGAYAIKGLPSSEFDIEFLPPYGYLADQFYDHKDHPWEAEPVPVGLGEVVSGVDATLEAGARIEGTVRRLDGAVLDVYPVRICAWESYGYGACTSAESEGSYVLPGLSPGEYKVEFFSYLHELRTQFWDHTSSLAEAEPLQLDMGTTVTGIDADLESEPAPKPKPPVVLPSLAAPSPFQAVPEVRHRRHCRKGFHKRRMMGRVRCVKKQKHRPPVGLKPSAALES